MNDSFFVEVDCQQKNHVGERICGDVLLSGKVREEGRVVVVLSDGMGHGVKASVLATLTATMALNFAKEHKEPEKIAEIIMRTLPECSERKMNYSTFTVLDIKFDGSTTILEYDNPASLIVRNKNIISSNRKEIILDEENNRGKKIYITQFNARKGDRVLFTSDGVTQSGLGTKVYPFGWGRENLAHFATDMVTRYPKISARQLATRVINTAFRNDGFSMKDDTSCGVVYFREPRQLLVVTGPPFNRNRDNDFANHVNDFNGKKIVMGGTTGDIIARELNLKITDGQDFTDPDLPPLSELEGVDLYTEGILTLYKVEKILKAYTNTSRIGRGPADQVVKQFLESDLIEFIVGTRINLAHLDPNSRLDLEIRRTVVKRIALMLEEKFLKEVRIVFV
ncbi:MAG: serine/threonine-protein phosphatase [Bacteroidales bacterium]|nr:serine/threonine-protein phosphatase [Bacteroidales bacterium]